MVNLSPVEMKMDLGSKFQPDCTELIFLKTTLNQLFLGRSVAAD
jgi:hypothetical protein